MALTWLADSHAFLSKDTPRTLDADQAGPVATSTGLSVTAASLSLQSGAQYATSTAVCIAKTLLAGWRRTKSLVARRTTPADAARWWWRSR